MTVGTVQVGDIVLRYRDHGERDAEPVVLLHGASSDATTWDKIAPTLVAAGRRAIAVDLRGHGGSSRSRDYSLVSHRDDIARLLDTFGLDRVALVGHSLGAHTASLLALQQPERVGRLLLEEPPVQPRVSAEPHGLPAAKFVVPALAMLVRPRSFDHRAVTSAIRQFRLPDPGLWDGLASVKSPTLVVSGGPTSHISPVRLAEMAAVMPNARLVTIPAGHRVHSLRPAEFEAEAFPFLTAPAA